VEIRVRRSVGVSERRVTRRVPEVAGRMGWAERGGITPVVSSRREICRRGEHAGGARTVAPAVGLRHPRSRSRSHRGRLGLFRSDSGRLPGVRLVLCTRRISTAPACRVTSSHSPLKLLYGIIESLNGSSSSYTTVFWFPSPTTLLRRRQRCGTFPTSPCSCLPCATPAKVVHGPERVERQEDRVDREAAQGSQPDCH
jgi:hypothetical protein